MAPTERQFALLRYVCGFQMAHAGASPAYSQCAQALGIASKSNVHRLLHGMQDRGIVRLHAGTPAVIEVLSPPAVPSIDGAPLYAVPLRAGRG
jgi:SOS-response transcriptional repressor LexA